MGERPLRADGNLGVVLSAWMFMLHGRGRHPASGAIANAITAVEGEETGRALVEAVLAELGPATEPADVYAFAQRQYGADAIGELGDGDREARVRRVRQFQFKHNTPWLARIYERHDEVVQPTWILIERVTDEVLALDPDPWDGIDEERVIPVADFMVLWELDGCPSVAARAC
ncbi:MAG: hypothetical protein KC912_00470 [Proteobacteria bacterium]|nr:hypothetical protein [Pseudomonadota bacterium]